MLERGFICLKDKNFEEAESVFDKVLNIDPHSGGAYLGRLMIRRRVSELQELEYQEDPMSLETDYQHAIEYGEPKIKKTLREYEKNIIEKNRNRAMGVIKERENETEALLENLKQKLLDNKRIIDKLKENLYSDKKVIEKNEKAKSAKRIAQYVILALHIMFWLPGTAVDLSNGDGMAIVNIIVAVLIWKFIMAKFVVRFIQSIIGVIYRQASNIELEHVEKVIDKTEKELDEKNIVDSEIQSMMAASEKELKQMQNNIIVLVDKLSMVPKRDMSEKLNAMLR